MNKILVLMWILLVEYTIRKLNKHSINLWYIINLISNLNIILII